MRRAEDLLVHRRQLLELARHLAGDAHSAEDLVQDTYLAALEAPAPSGSARRRLREILRTKARGERRRRRRERSVRPRRPGGEATAADDDLVAEVARELARLEEPYRSTLRRRFLEGLAPHDIAALDGAPLKTVYTRLARGTELLRERLERRLGALAPLLLLLGGRRASSRVRLALACALPVAAAVALAARLPPRLLHGTAAERPALVAPLAQARDLASPATEPPPRPHARRRSAAPTPPATPAHPSYTGVVVDERGRPVGGATVVYEGGALRFTRSPVLENFFDPADPPVTVEVRSAPDGSFRIDVPPGDGRIVARASHLAPVIAEIVPTDRGDDPLRPVVGPLRELSGVVVDGAGEPIPGARLRLRPPGELVAALERRERTWFVAGQTAETDELGRFRIPDAIDLPGTRLQVEREDFLVQREVDAGVVELEVVVPDARARLETLRGWIVTPDMDPVPAAGVVARHVRALTGPDGSFEVPVAPLARVGEAWGFAAGMLPAHVAFDVLPGGAPDLPPELVLRLPGPARAISGVVVDAAGRPLPGAWVWCADPTPLYEDLTAGFAEAWVSDLTWDEPFYVVAGPDGRFRMSFLLERAYRLGALERSTLRASLSDPIAAGSADVVLAVPTDEPPTPVRGRVLDADGAPVPSARVALVRPMQITRPTAGHREFRVVTPGEETATDERGEFRLSAAPARGCALRVTGAGLLATDHPVPPPGERAGVVLVAPRRARVQVSLAAAEPDAAVALLDADGERLPLSVAADHDRSTAVQPLRELPARGRALDLLVPDTARTAVLLVGGSEVGRCAVRPVAGRIVAVELARGAGSAQ